MWPGSSLGGRERGLDHPPKGVWREGFLKEGAQGASAPWAKQGSRAGGEVSQLRGQVGEEGTRGLSPRFPPSCGQKHFPGGSHAAFCLMSVP